MYFLKSIISDDPDPPLPENDHDSGGRSPAAAHGGDGTGDPDERTEGWSWNLIRKLTVQSESVIETYRRDLKEFGLGLRKESEILRETASRAVKELPASIEATASAAHGALDGVLKSTAEIIAKESLVFAPDREPETPETNRSFTTGRYSWFEAQYSAIQNDLNTFCEEPENVEEYRKWRSGFELEDYKDEIDFLIGEDGAMQSVYNKIVPSVVDHETFWCRYYYRLDKLKQQERVRANLVKRMAVDDDDDDLTWDVDDEEDVDGIDPKEEDAGEGKIVGNDENSNAVEKQQDSSSSSGDEKEGGGNVNVDDDEKRSKSDSSKERSVDSAEAAEGANPGETVDIGRVETVKSDESVKEKNGVEMTEGKSEPQKGNNASVVLSHQEEEEEEEDVGWDEIGDIGSDDDKKTSATTRTDSPIKHALQKRLSAMEDDEDISWDIEDDDEPVKA